MFKLKKLELLGFKSFADRTRLEFAEETAAIVGPNGCGKSNLSDAISWVLGEQSARLLRGERMADVIFSGTRTRPPTSMAEVSITLVDPDYENADARGRGGEPEIRNKESAPMGDSALPVPPISEPPANGHGHGEGNGNGSSESGTSDSQRAATAVPHSGEIVVTRRLFRSGESEYLLNGKVCRLRDIQDLFMGTGLGPESYALIEQGRIGQILSSKPSDRRAILEEAAGISKFKTRKRLSEAKLESARQNLARITDILEEVSTQVNSLKRQASKARRYREMQEELRGRQKVVLASKLMALEAECGRIREELGAAETQSSEAAEQLQHLEQRQKVAAQQHEEREGRLTELREQIAQGDLERERFQSRLEQIRQSSATLTARASEAIQEDERLQSEWSSLKQEAGEIEGRIADLRQESTAAQAIATQLQAHQHELSATVAQGEADVEASRLALLTAVSRVSDLRNQLVQIQEMGLALDRQMSRSAAERASAEEERSRLTCELETLSSEDQLQAGELSRLTEAIAETTRVHEQASVEEAARRAEVERLRHEFSTATARKQALEESLARHAYSTESVRRLLSTNALTNGQGFNPLGLLADFVEVASGYEEVVEDLLKQELDCVVVERHDQARSGIELLRGEGAGRSTFFVTQVPSNGHKNGNGHSEARGEPGVVASLRDVVRFDPRLGLNGDPAIEVLQKAYLVEDGATAERLAGRYPDSHFLTRNGEHYHHRLVAGGTGPSAGPLALRRDFRELDRRVQDLELGIRETEGVWAQAATRMAQLGEELRVLAASRVEAGQKAVLAGEKARQAREARDRNATRLETLRSETAALQEERSAVVARETFLTGELETGRTGQAQREQELSQKTQHVRELRVQLDRVTQELIDAQSRSGVLEARIQALEAERSRVLAQADAAQSRLAKIDEQIEGWHSDVARLAEERESLQARFERQERAQQLAREELNREERESHFARVQRDKLAPLADAARAAFEACREKRSAIEVQRARAESDLAHHIQQCRNELNAEPAFLLAEFSPETALAGEALQAAEEELRSLRTRLENLGPVNMMALEELQEAEERFAFLETQRQDLLASIEDTVQAIREIDQVSRQRFSEAFKAINANFAETFRTLFGGGTGEMRLTDEADAESGIDVVAQPPGKRLQNVLLLSGGEKALAALALLIAIFRYTPSPFCILDEVDAPLDESNVERFTRMIEQMSRQTQFILITHNKRTMETAKVMYGVTMEDPGVSKLVSVRFDQIERATLHAFAASAP